MKELFQPCFFAEFFDRQELMKRISIFRAIDVPLDCNQIVQIDDSKFKIADLIIGGSLIQT